MSDIYQTPQANLEKEPSGERQGGSVEDGIAGNYQFEIGAVFNEAWNLVAGAKGTFVLAIIIFMAIYIGIAIISNIIITALSFTVPNAEIVRTLSVLLQLVLVLVTTPMTIGLIILGMQRSANASIQSTSILSHYPKMIPLFLTYLLMYLLVIVGFLFLIIPGIYLSISYYMALPLVAEKNMGPWQALETSRKAITHRWFSFFFFGIIVGIIILISALPLGIGLIWSLPFSLIAYGIIYRNMFGIEKATLENQNDHPNEVSV